MVRLAGIEPTTPWFVAKYSIQLSYSRQASNYSLFKWWGVTDLNCGPKDYEFAPQKQCLVKTSIHDRNQEKLKVLTGQQLSVI
jgi:hypothetical protein